MTAGAIRDEIKHIDRGRKEDIKLVREFIFRWALPVYVIPSEVNSLKRAGCRGVIFLCELPVVSI